MAEKLKDPSKPAGYVFPEDVNPDGSATRNDGQKLKSARTNPWYVLATLYDEHKAGTDPWDWKGSVVRQNRQAWNAWAGADMSDEERSAMAEKMGLAASELEMPEPEYRKVLLEMFRAQMGDKTAQLPSSNERIDFSATYFEKPVGFSKYVFAGDADFHTAAFAGYADFRSAAFASNAYFRSAAFAPDADFQSATFAGDAAFYSAAFAGKAIFSPVKFRSTTDFGKAIFEKHVPEFHAAELYADTTFELPDTAAEQRKHWPPVRGRQDQYVMPAKDQKRAYNRLRLFMNQSLQTEEEQFFHRREMACKKELEGPFMFGVYWLYENLSDYGYSVARPLARLFGNFIVGGIWFFTYLWWYHSPISAWSILDAFGISFANVFPFFGLGRRFVDPVFYEQLGRWTTFVASLQTVFGFIFVFLLGLGLRSRFRLR